MSDIDRFWKHVDKTGECWIWTGASDSHGYGHFTVTQERATKHFKAHRWIYEQTCGPIPEGMVIDHTCHNHACVRPEHLKISTQQANVRNQRLRSDNKTGFRGVKFEPRTGRYEARVQNNGRMKSLGTFTTPEEAADCLRTWRSEHWGIREVCNV